MSETDVLYETLDWTLDRYHAAIEAGVLGEEDNVELIRGKLVRKMPVSKFHAALIEFLVKLFIKRLGIDAYRYRSENPVPIPEISEPQPGLVIADTIPDKDEVDIEHPAPEEIRLVIEVAYSSLSVDRTIKAELYAEAGIAEYWIINLKAKRVEVHLHPLLSEARYQTVISFSSDQVIDSPFLGDFAVADLKLHKFNPK